MTVLLFTNREVITRRVSNSLSPTYDILAIDNPSRVQAEAQREDTIAIYIDMNHTYAKNVLNELNSSHITTKLPVIIIVKSNAQLFDLSIDPELGWAKGVVWFMPELSTLNSIELTAILSRAIAEWKNRSDPIHRSTP